MVDWGTIMASRTCFFEACFLCLGTGVLVMRAVGMCGMCVHAHACVSTHTCATLMLTYRGTRACVNVALSHFVLDHSWLWLHLLLIWELREWQRIGPRSCSLTQGRAQARQRSALSSDHRRALLFFTLQAPAMADEWISCPDRAWEVLSRDSKGGCHPKLPSGLNSLGKVKVTAGQGCRRWARLL